MLALQLDASAQDQDRVTGFYAKVDMGGAWSPNVEINEFIGARPGGKAELEPGIRFDMGVGYKFAPWIAAEFETGVIWNDIKGASDSELVNWPLMVNVVFEMPTRTRFIPFAGIGAGGVASTLFIDHLFTQDGAFIHGEDTDMVFAWQAFGGLKYVISDHFDVSLSYRYLNAEGPSWDVEPDFFGPVGRIEFDRIESHAIVAGATFRF